MTLVKASTDAA